MIISQSMTWIIATLWPASNSKEKLWQLYKAGVTIFRFNFAHETIETASKEIADIRALEQEYGVKIQVLLDAEWPGIRTGIVKENITYTTGDQFKIFVSNQAVEGKDLTCDYTYLAEDVVVGWIVKIDSGLFDVKVLAKHTDYILVEALNDFVVRSRRHINLPGVHIRIPSFTDKDKEDVLFAVQAKYDFVALSFVRSAADMQELRTFLDTNWWKEIKIVAKIENEEWLQNISEIAQASDVVMVARGDLGTELPLWNLPVYQKTIIQATKAAGKQVVVATEMLLSMVRSPNPTRAEVTDVFSAVTNGADYVMLSEETTMGDYPVKCVEMMRKIIDTAEASV